MEKNVLTSDVNYILYCPSAVFSMCSHQKCPFHGLGIVFPQQSIAFLTLCNYSFKNQAKSLITEFHLCAHRFDINGPFKRSFSLILLVKRHLNSRLPRICTERKHLRPAIHRPRKAPQGAIPTSFHLDRSALAE